MPPKLHEAAAAPESSHSCCVGKYGNTTVQVMHNARHRPQLTYYIEHVAAQPQRAAAKRSEGGPCGRLV